MREYTVELNRNYAWDMTKFHFHDHYEVLLSLTDAGAFWVDENSFDLRRGSLILLSPNLLHRSNASPDILYERYILRFSREYVRKMSTPASDLTSCFCKGEYVHRLSEDQISAMLALYARCAHPEPGFGGDLRADIAFIEMLLHLCVLVGRLEPAPSMTGKDFQRLAPVLGYIKENLSEAISLDEIASHAYLSKHYLCNLFKRTTGFSVGEYIINSRVLLAQRYLRDGTSVQRAGELAGFSNNSHFIRTFHNMVGCSPGKYAKRYKDLAP